jgi:hypothetical protein
MTTSQRGLRRLSLERWQLKVAAHTRSVFDRYIS